MVIATKNILLIAMNTSNFSICLLPAIAVILGTATAGLARPGYVVTEDLDGFVNVRSSPGTDEKISHCADNGTALEISRSAQGSDNYTWYNVQLNSKGAKGWIREDFLSFSQPAGGGQTWSGKCGSVLRPGTYYGGGSRYISITQLGNRLCYGGSSHSFGVVGTTSASIYQNSNEPGVYRIHNFEGGILKQKSPEILLWGAGEKEYELINEGSGNSNSPCLQSSQPFFEQTSHRDRSGVRR